jgi:hypothetical protein
MNLSEEQREIPRTICAGWGVVRLAVFGSWAMGGVAVDLRTPRDHSRHLRDDVVRSAEVLYAA